MSYPPNGDGGYYHFPSSDRVTYIIRDNDNATCSCSCVKDEGKWDVFVVQGIKPSIRQFNEQRFIGTFPNYDQACLEIEKVQSKVLRMVMRLQRQARYFDGNDSDMED